MSPRFPRTRKFANPYALAAVDFLFALLWLSAFAALASWNGTRKCEDGCGVSKGVVGLGVIIWFEHLFPEKHNFADTCLGSSGYSQLQCQFMASSIIVVKDTYPGRRGHPITPK